MEDLSFGSTSPYDKHEDEVHRSLQQPDDRDEEYEQFLADVWVGVVLTLMVVSCVCCVCSCLLYHKFQQWKRNVLEARAAQSVESGNAAPVNDVESLPSYTLVSGLPSYDEALEQFRQSRAAISKEIEAQTNTSVTSHEPRTPVKLSASDLLHQYKNLTTV